MSFNNAIKSLQSTVNKIFGDSVIYTSVEDNSSTTIQGVFDNAWVEIQMVNSLKPILKINLSDLVNAPKDGDLLVIKNKNYRVIDSQPDSFGSTTLILEKI